MVADPVMVELAPAYYALSTCFVAGSASVLISEVCMYPL